MTETRIENTTKAKKIVTRPYDPMRYKESSARVKPIEFQAVIKRSFEAVLSHKADFIDLSRFFPYGSPIYAHCIAHKPDEPAPSLQIFHSDILLGDINIEGFYKLLFDPQNENPEKSAKKSYRELGRYQRAETISLQGYFIAKSV